MDSQASVDFLQDGIDKLKKLTEDMGISESDVILENTVYVKLPCLKNNRSYLLRIDCNDYPIEPADYKFVNPQTKLDSSPEDWPNDNNQGFKIVENPRWICIVGTREYKKRHPGSPIDPNENLLHRVVFHIFSQMNK